MSRPKNRSGLIRAPRPAAPAPAPAPAPVQKQTGLGTIMKEGFAWGVGQSAAHAIMNRILVPALTSGPVNVPSVGKNPEYEQCMKEFNDETGCKHLLQG